ncbi:MAG: C25 family cysteine peptidase [Candidatus Acidiferrum sp.]
MRKPGSIVVRNSARFGEVCSALLEAGASVRFRANGLSMRPNILDNDAVVVVPVQAKDLRRGDVAFTRGADGFRVHRVAAADGDRSVITRSDAAQGNDAATDRIFGKVIAIERSGRRSSLSYPGQKYVHACRSFVYQFAQAAALRATRLASASAFLALAMLCGLLLLASPAAGQSFTVTNTPNPATGTVGTSITYTQVITSGNGGTISHPITTTQTVPTGMTFVSAIQTGGQDTWTCALAAGVITCTDNSTGTYPRTKNTTFSIVLTINSSAANGTLAETVTAKGNNTVAAAGTGNITVTIPDISITNTDNPATLVNAGANITYTQVITNNNATFASQGLTFSETIPTGANYQSITIPTGWTCPTLPTVGGIGSISCTDAAGLAASASSSFIVVVQVNASTPSTTVISDTASVVQAANETNTTNNTATATTTVTIPDLSVTNTDAPDPISDGGNITYTQVVKNNTTTIGAINATLTESIPTGTTYQSIAIPVGWTCGTLPAVNTTGTISCTAATFAASASSTFSVVVQVNAATPAGTLISDTVTVSETGTDPTPANNTATTTTTVTIPDIQVTNADAPDPIDVSSNITYTQVVKNNSTTVAAVNPTLTETIPTNTTYQSITIPAGWACGTLPVVNSTGTISCTAATLAASASSTFSVVVQVNAATPSGTTISDTVTVGETGTDPTPANNTATTTTTVTVPDLSVTETAASNPVEPGGNITYTQTVQNITTTVGAIGATLTQTTPTGTTFQSVTPPTGWTCGTQPAVGGTGSIVCTANATFAASASVNFSVVVAVNPALASGTTISNSVTVSETGTDPNSANNTATSTVTVQNSDISVTDAASPNPVATGANITYTQTVTNNSTVVSAAGVTLTTTTPLSTWFQSVTPPAGWTCTSPAVGAAGSIVCTTTGTLAANTSVNFSVVVSVSPEAAVGSTISNTVTVSEEGTDPNLGNNTATATVVVQGADLSMTQVASVKAIAPGNTITYTETVTNNGPNAATGATVYQQTPVNTTFVSMTPPTGWTCGTLPASGGTGQVICTANASMAANTTTANFTYVVTVGATTAAGTVVTNQADVTSQITDGNPANNGTFTSVLVELTPDADLSVAVTALPTPVFISSSITYTIQVSNFGLAPGTGVTLTDTLPFIGTSPNQKSALSSVTATSTQGTCTVNTTTYPFTVTCALGGVAYPLSTPITITISGTSPATPMTLSNTATVSSSSTDPVSTNNSVTTLTVVQPLVCATPGNDGSPSNPITGVVNAYYPPSGTGTVAAGATSIALGPAATNGAQTSINTGDLVLIIQMQGAQINSTNTTSYGDGIPGDPFGSTSLGSTGVFEFVTATNSVVTAAAGGTLTFIGTGANNGLLNTYISAVASSSQGAQTFQVIRVPQYSSVTLGSGSTTVYPAMAWNGATGGVLALDVATQLTLGGGSVVLDGYGFRGGGALTERGITGFLKTDTVDASPTALPNLSGGGDPPTGGGAGGGKGEGIAGTPHWVAPSVTMIAHASTASSTAQTYVEGYPNGSFARGAPGNAGGGATDADPAANDQNSGGAGAGNGGQGGLGGFGWDTAGLVGGYGGAPFPTTTSALIMGGGGGGGTTNNGSYWDPSTDTGNADCGLNCTGVYSSGGAGGGIVIIHAGAVIGSGTITSNGQTALSPENDGGGGGGAGGTILVFANSGGLSGLTAIANGGNGGNTWPEETPGSPFPDNRHGAGGGGGGGVIFTTAPTNSASSAANGNPGWSTLANDPYGATPGQPGVINSSLTVTQTPGTQSGAYCAGADLAVTNSGTPNPVLAGPGPGNVITYTQGVTNNGPLDAVNAVFSETIPANTTFQSIAIPVGWTCGTLPAVGATGSISCTNPDLAKSASSSFTVGVAVNIGVASGTVITDIDNVTAGNNDPNLTNNSATVQTTVGLSTTADLSISNVASPNPVIAGNNITYTVVVMNNGASTASNVSFSEAIPANTTFVSATPTPATGWTCLVSGGTLTCSDAALGAGASTSFAVVVTVNSATAAGTVITDTANVSSVTVDPNPNNNSATATDVVATSGQSDLSVTSAATPDPVTDGNNISYAQTVTNNGPSASGTATFTDTIPTGATFVSLAVPSGWNCGTLPAVGGTGTITCTIASLAVNATASFPLVIKSSLGDTPGTAIVNTASINAPCSSTTDPNCSNNTATTTIYVASPTQADVAIVKTASPDPVDQGTNLTYTLQITNNGPAVAQGVVVTDPIPGEVTFVSASSTQGTCTNSSSPVIVTCTIGSVSVGGAVVVNINATANTFSSTTLSTNTATVTATTGDPNLTNNTSSFVSTIATPTAVQLASFRAYPRQGGGVLLEWKTRAEVRNLGFNVYRVEGSSRQRLNPSIIAGSALRIRGALPQHAAKTYQWFDPSGTAQAVYELEDVDLNGTRTTHGPVSEDVSAPPRAGAMVQPLLLSQMNRAIVQPILNTRRVLASPMPILPPTPQGTVAASLDGDAAVKISVQNEGWYQVTKSQLVAAGFNPNSDARTLQLYAEGIEQPFLILGNQSGPLGPNDSMEFYGTGIDTPYSGTRVYWLISGSQPGMRISSIAAPGSASSGLQSFPFTVVLQQRTTYFGTLLNGDNNDNFFGATVTSEPVDQQLTIAHLDPNSPMQATVDITLQGATDQQGHSVSVQFNGASIGEMDFSNLANVTNTFPINSSLLQDGVNTVTLTALQGDNDVSVVQSIALHYPHTYEADGNWLKATAPAGSSVHVGGFTNQQVQVFDITNPLAISQLNGTVAQEDTAYGVTFGLQQNAEQTRTLLIFSGDQIAPPSGLAFHAPADLAAQSFGSQMIIITHPDFQSAIAPLVSLHQSRGMSVQVVTIDEVFDAFNYGERSPYAIRDFLQSAESNWIRKPQFLFLVGAASLDPRDYLGLGDFDFVPTRIVETAAFKTASDDWFSDFNQTGFATIATGRIPVRTPADATLVVSKLVNFEKGLGANAANPQALLVADQNIGADFTTATNFAATDLPAAFQPLEIFAQNQDPSVVSQQILTALNAGPLLVNYSGHGAEEQWSFSDLLDDTSAATLSNGDQLSVYFLMDCLNGFFQDVYATSLAESLLLAPNGGAAAVWASSGFTNQPPQASMNQALLQILKANPSTPLASAILQAKTGVTDSDVRRTWIFFGDPAMTLQLPPSSSTGPHPPIGVHPPIVLKP